MKPRQSRQTLWLHAIPLDKVVGLDVDGLKTFIEFDAFDDIRAGTVCIDAGLLDGSTRPACVHPRSSLASIVEGGDDAAQPAHRAGIERDLAALLQEPTLQGVGYLGRLKAQLEFNIACGCVLERALGFMDYPRYAVLKGRWTDALSTWLTQHPAGRSIALSCTVDVLAEAMLIHYRDAGRSARRDDIARNIAMKLGEWKYMAAARLWAQHRGVTGIAPTATPDDPHT